MLDFKSLFLEAADEHPISFGLHENDLTNFPMHYHPMLEVVFCFEGKLNLLTGEKEITLNKDDIALISPLAIHGYEAETSSNNLTIIFDEDVYMDLEDSFIFNSAQRIQVLRNMTKDQIDILEDCLQHIAFHYGSKDTTLLTLYCKIFLTHLFRFIIADKSDQKIDDLYASPYIKDILSYIQSHYRENITLDDLAKNVNINRFTISKLINQHLNSTFTNLINQYRLLDACQLLKNSSISILEVSERVGYGSLNSFNRNFLERFGITPKEFRKRKKSSSTFFAFKTSKNS